MPVNYAIPGADSERAWVRDALLRYQNTASRDFTCSSTPGAGKTRFALIVAHQLITNGEVERIVVVVPTDHLREQWKDAAARLGIQLDPKFMNDGREARDYDGVVVTYQQVVSAPLIHRGLCRRTTLVILDEPHHMSDAENQSWGVAISEAFEPATRRLLITGTPFRTDRRAIPFVRYVDGRPDLDFRYSYGEALMDGICRPVYFPSYEGRLQWWTGSGGDIKATFRDPLSEEESRRRLRTALDPGAQWLPAVLRDADRRLNDIRRHQYQKAGGLVIAMDQGHARAIAQMLAKISGEQASVAVSDDPSASATIKEFRDSDRRWLIAVKMVSEGVDIPRLCVGVYATNYLTEVYFRQAVGRFVRLIPEVDDVGAHLFIPHDDRLIGFVQSIKEERDHAISDRDDGEDTGRIQPKDVSERVTLGTIPLFVPGSAEAEADEVFTPDRESFSQEEMSRARQVMRAVGLDGLSDVLVAKLGRGYALVQAPPEPVVSLVSAPVEPLADRKSVMRKQVRSLVNTFVARSSHEYSQVYLMLETATGAKFNAATLEQLEHGRRLLQGWLERTDDLGTAR